MLIGYVSDEYHYALPGVLLEFEQDSAFAGVVSSTPSGAIYVDIEPGEYGVTLSKDGYGAKKVTMRVKPDRPYQFRLLSDCLLGYMWPKWVRIRPKIRVPYPHVRGVPG